MEVGSIVVFFRDATSSSALGFSGLTGIGSPVVFLSFGLSFSNLGFLGLTVRVSDSVCGSGFVLVLLACKWGLRCLRSWATRDFFCNIFLSLVLVSAQEALASLEQAFNTKEKRKINLAKYACRAIKILCRNSS